jgi:hypothetical protein
MYKSLSIRRLIEGWGSMQICQFSKSTGDIWNNPLSGMSKRISLKGVGIIFLIEIIDA